MKYISKTYRFIAIMLVFLMFLTSVGFNLDVHLCQGKLKSFNFFGKAKNCYQLAGEFATNSCTHQANKVINYTGCALNKKDCCENKTLHFQSHQNLEQLSSESKISISLKQFVVALVASFFTDFQIEKRADLFVFYSPPYTSEDIYALNQSFRL